MLGVVQLICVQERKLLLLLLLLRLLQRAQAARPTAQPDRSHAQTEQAEQWPANQQAKSAQVNTPLRSGPMLRPGTGAWKWALHVRAASALDYSL
jgi:hypothetical protein